jgi:hypothetical protein
LNYGVKKCKRIQNSKNETCATKRESNVPIRRRTIGVQPTFEQLRRGEMNTSVWPMVQNWPTFPIALPGMTASHLPDQTVWRLMQVRLPNIYPQNKVVVITHQSTQDQTGDNPNNSTPTVMVQCLSLALIQIMASIWALQYNRVLHLTTTTITTWIIPGDSII